MSANLETSANALAGVAARGNRDEIKASFGAMAKNCGACHKAYRTPKKKK
ncbi:MAG: cytochrome c [Alphaproteobacteria bacterium]